MTTTPKVSVPVDGQSFSSEQDWINRASRVLTAHPAYNNAEHGEAKGWRGHHFTALSFDQAGNRMRSGADFKRATNEATYPVWWIWPDQIPAALAAAPALTAPAREGVERACASFQEAIDYFENDVADALAEGSERADLWYREISVNIDVLKTVMVAALTARHEAPAEGAGLLREAAAKFRFYEASHRAKKTDEAAVKAEVNSEIAGRIEAFLRARPAPEASPQVEAVAWVPIHPRSGPIWPECGPDAREKDNLKSYPFEALYTHPQPAQTPGAGGAHYGDPCVRCGVGHDIVPPGPCRADGITISRERALAVLDYAKNGRGPAGWPTQLWVEVQHFIASIEAALTATQPDRGVEGELAQIIAGYQNMGPDANKEDAIAHLCELLTAKPADGGLREAEKLRVAVEVLEEVRGWINRRVEIGTTGATANVIKIDQALAALKEGER